MNSNHSLQFFGVPILCSDNWKPIRANKIQGQSTNYLQIIQNPTMLLMDGEELSSQAEKYDWRTLNQEDGTIDTSWDSTD